MRDELSTRQAAIRLRLAGENIENICQTLNRSEPWFHKWWRRYLDAGPTGLYDLTRARRQVTNRTPPHIERAVISIRQRLAKRERPETRYGLVGAEQIRAELENLGYSPLPSARTIERIVSRAGLSCPQLQLAPRIARTAGSVLARPAYLRTGRVDSEWDLQGPADQANRLRQRGRTNGAYKALKGDPTM